MTFLAYVLFSHFTPSDVLKAICIWSFHKICIHICSWMHEQSTTLERNGSLGYHHVVWKREDKTYRLKRSILQHLLIFSVWLQGVLSWFKSFIRPAKSAPICLFFAFNRVWLLEPGRLKDYYPIKSFELTVFFKKTRDSLLM